MAKRKSSAVQKTIKKTNPLWLLIFVVLFIGLGLGGYFVGSVVTKGDTFEIVGEKVVELEFGTTSYEDPGAKAIAFKKDISNKISTEQNIDFTTPGQYYIKYSVDHWRYKDVYRYRTIIILEEEV